MHDNEGLCNLTEDGCMITRCILEVERLSWMVDITEKI